MKIDPEINAKREIWQKREADEFKKLEKILKKEKNDFEDTASTGAKNVKTVYDRFMKTFNQIKKLNSQVAIVESDSNKFAHLINEKKKQVDSNLKKKEIMNGLCDQFLKKMSDLYL